VVCIGRSERECLSFDLFFWDRYPCLRIMQSCTMILLFLSSSSPPLSFAIFLLRYPSSKGRGRVCWAVHAVFSLPLIFLQCSCYIQGSLNMITSYSLLPLADYSRRFRPLCLCGQVTIFGTDSYACDFLLPSTRSTSVLFRFTQRRLSSCFPLTFIPCHTDFLIYRFPQ